MFMYLGIPLQLTVVVMVIIQNSEGRTPAMINIKALDKMNGVYVLTSFFHSTVEV